MWIRMKVRMVVEAPELGERIHPGSLRAQCYKRD